uniref:MogA/MoaB family molybdenum cofactor biosynthesis protein n=1 Tax=Geoglobus ahangari TaxID=113653 RepID=A0A7C3YG15_9EURY
MHEMDVDFKVDIITVSTSRFEKYGRVEGKQAVEDDESGRILIEAFRDKFNKYYLIPDDIQEIRNTVTGSDADVIITTGGTGLNPRDVTIEALEDLFTKRIDGFGELFRMESIKQIGYHVVLSRATAGIIGSKVVFCLPGSKNAVQLGVKIIKEVIKHILSHVKGLR